MFHSIDMKKTIALLILILFYVIPAYSLPITGKEPQGVKDKFFPDGRGNPSKGDDKIYRIVPEE
ncbi:MAG: hypothetical protein A2X54_06885 [Nitrospirae bacterium GWF2_44_13]|nr:MAG: hypothetical protein A2X54_06885 [Nitrospirae bacterium GWF2_44_13]OGW63280.1 MAG: hypothetical protein A2222_07425 [Nitrospirae bacterium RIFOXYA2_FULL_44_9]HBU05457.1 hypothetical protein [Nitrospiraceae bacterium]